MVSRWHIHADSAGCYNWSLEATILPQVTPQGDTIVQ